jgi:hypothetical protein
MISLEEYDNLVAKMDNLEKEVIDIHERYLTVAETLREMQRYMVKMAQNQAQIAQQISLWPYIVVEKKSTPKGQHKE